MSEKWKLPLALATIACIASSQLAQAAVVQAKKADDFVDSTGVVVKLGGGKPNSEWTTVRAKLLASGLRNIREGYNSTTVVNRLIDLNNNGMKVVWLLTPSQGTRPNSNYWITGDSQFNKDNVVDFLKNRIGVNRVRAVEMNNELDVFYGQTRWFPTDASGLSNDPNSNRYYINYLKDATRDTSNALKADPATANLPLLGPSLVNPDHYASLGNLGAYVSHGTAHWYLAGRHPETGGWADNGYGSYEHQKSHMAGLTAPGKPIVSTEGMGNTFPGADQPGSAWWPEDIHGRYYPRWFLKQFMGGSPIAISYTFVDDGTNANDPEQNFGLLRHDLTEKPAYKAIKNLLTLLKEPNANFTPGSVDMTLSGDTGGVQQLLLQKSNGTYYLCLWLDKKSWNMEWWDGPQGRRTVNPQSVTLGVSTFAGTSVTYHTLNDAGDMTSSSSSISTGKTVSLAVTDRVAVVQFTTAASSNQNLVSNPGFEAEQFGTQTPSGWSESSSVGGVGSGYTDAGSTRSGNYKYSQWNSSAYNMYTFQTKTGLTNGLYTLRAWARRSAGHNVCQLEAKDYGGALRSVAVPNSGSYQLLEIKDINVTNGQCTFGIWSDANAGNWSQFDDFEFFRQSSGGTTIPIGQRISIKALNNNLFVMSNQSNGSILQASAGAVGTWEPFTVVDAGGGLIALRASVNNLFVMSNQSVGGRLQATAGSIGSWEKFVWQDLGNNTFALKADINGKYVQNNISSGNTLIAQTNTINDNWQKFVWAPAP